MKHKTTRKQRKDLANQGYMVFHNWQMGLGRRKKALRFEAKQPPQPVETEEESK